MATKVTPIRKQYLDIKHNYPDALLFFRLGDFYETFDEDAEITARELDIVLTSRNIAKGSRIPMAGIPHHAAEGYIARLIERGYHVAICDQVGDRPVKGLFPREVVRVITPGTVVEAELLPGDRNNYLVSVILDGNNLGIAIADISTGEFSVGQFESEDRLVALQQELYRLSPAEVLIPETLSLEGIWDGNTTKLPDWRFELDRAVETLQEHFGTSTLAGFGLDEIPAAVRSAGAIVEYLRSSQEAALSLLTGLSIYSLDDFMTLDAATRRNLELTETIRTGDVRASLLGILDQTRTPMGRRLLRQWLGNPLLDLERIEGRLNQVEAFHDDGVWRAEIRSALKAYGDLERLTNRIIAAAAKPGDLVAMEALLEKIPQIKGLLQHQELKAITGITAGIDDCEDVFDLLKRSINDDPPVILGKVGVIRPGFSVKLDDLVESSRAARDWIANLEKVERERSGIKSLKVGYNKVFGYYIEVTKANSERVPEDYIRKQTLINAERYITPEMKEYESLVLTAEEQIREVEREIFHEICAQITDQAARLLGTARAIGRLDVVNALAEVAAHRNFIRPELVVGDALDIQDGRHPVVEELIPGKRFIPNDIQFEDGERIRVITGPNMSGKSTYLRQVALIVLMAQMGSFVPAQHARLGIVDRIFTRIGAQDEIHAGQSTFMVEMVEMANILHNASNRSLVILDEVGRGTSTYDGVAIAWAVVEYLHNHPKLRARTLFATHYHELTRLAEFLPGVRNYNVAVSEEGGKVVFLHKITPGGADKSYGIHVAELAGIPRPVINRAQEILAQFEAASDQSSDDPQIASKQLHLFSEADPLLEEIRALDLNSLSPLEALNRLYEWQQRFGRDDRE
ncbi:MAG: DNA mismatch repair protein MutS [Anaerolineales bacterium]|nr:DNA mismatch repair protein MutS [Anaerolineales bacterium]